MNRLLLAAFLIIGAIIGAACSRSITHDATASVPHYHVIDVSKLPAASTPAGLQKFLNGQTAQGYQLQEVIPLTGWLVLVKQ